MLGLPPFIFTRRSTDTGFCLRDFRIRGSGHRFGCFHGGFRRFGPGIGLGIGLGCLWISHYALGLTSPLADNISANVVGLGLGTLFRFWSYRKWVFREELELDEADHHPKAPDSPAALDAESTGDLPAIR